MVKVAVVTVSDRVSAGVREDVSGPLAARLLASYGYVLATSIVPDGTESVRRAIVEAVEAGATVVFTTGGTGVTSRDRTPEATETLLEQRMLGIENLLRANPNVPQSALSRGLAGIVRVGDRAAFVVNAPGSPGGVTDAVRVIGPLLGHIVEQMCDGDHPVPDDADGSVDVHADATRRLQNRGTRDRSDASVTAAGVWDTAILMAELVASVDDRTTGAVATFCGQVRDHDDGKSVVAIDYHAHPEADSVVKRIAREVARSSGACKIAVVHRTGRLEVGDIALGAAVSASHRGEAFRLLEMVVEQVKMQVPVWKCQEFADGTREWTGAA